MKICWDNLEKIRVNKKGYFVIWHGVKLIYKDSCGYCGEPFLNRIDKESNFCSVSCSKQGKNNPMYGRSGKLCPSYGKPKSKETKIKLSESNKDFKPSEKHKKIISLANSGKGNAQWKGGVRKLNLPLYDTYAHQLNFAEEVRICNDIEDRKLLEVKCAYCDRWFVPKTKTIKSRIDALGGKPKSGESRLYCSDGCKDSCPIYRQQLFPKGFKHNSSREVDPYIRKLCFERDEWMCQKCNSDENLHCHHIQGYAQNKILANDIDNCLTLCKDCHKEVHKQNGCNYDDLKCNKDKGEE